MKSLLNRLKYREIISSDQACEILTARPSPVIILGCHRSGTTLVAKALREAGLFLGQRRDSNEESSFFAGLNQWILRICGGSWDNPNPIRHLLEQPDLTAGLIDFLRVMTASHSRMDQTANGLGRWGWKDPRNSITLPLWLKVFPHARVVCIDRHGVDVASSLWTRETANAAELTRQLKAEEMIRSKLHLQRRMTSDLVYSFRCSTLQGAFDLWREYRALIAANLDVDGLECCALAFETVVDAPVRELAKTAEFCGLSIAQDVLEQMAGSSRRDRAFAYRNDPAMIEFGERHQAVLERYGYT